MAIHLIEGFDLYNSGNASNLRDSPSVRSWWSRAGFTFGIGLQSYATLGDGRYPGSKALYYSGGTGNESQRTLGAQVPGGNRLVSGFNYKAAISFNGTTDHFQYLSGTTVQVAFRPTTGRALQVRNGSGTVLGATADGFLLNDGWQYLELDVVHHETEGEVRIWSDGQLVLELTNVNTVNGGATEINQWYFIARGDGTSRVMIDDLYLADERPIEFAHGARVVTCGPAADAAVSMVPVGAATNWQATFVPHNTGAISVRTPGTGTPAGDLYTGEPLPADVDTDEIACIQTRYVMHLDLATGNFQARALLKSGSTLDPGATFVGSGNNTALDMRVHEVDPDTGLPWTEDGVNDVQFGAEALVVPGGRYMRMYWASREVLVGAAPPPPEGAQLTQAAVLVLHSEASSMRTTQAAVLVLHNEHASARTTQVSRLTLVAEKAQAMATQAALLVLGTYVPCVTTWCQCWKITRQDGVVYRFTTHDEPVIFRGEEYTPCDSLAASAIDTTINTAGNTAGDVEVLGLFSDSAIRSEDVADGLLDGARFEAWRVDWGDPTEIPRRLVKGILSSTTQERASYKATVLTPATRLAQQPLLETYTPSCRFELGDARCGVDLDSYRVAGAVASVPALNAVLQLHRRQFTDPGRTEVNDYFALGTLVWVTGDNAGRRSEVKSSRDGVITLWSPVPNPIRVGDTYEMVPGCDKRKQTCKGLYNNYVRFGGFPDIPGQDAILETPDAKAG